MPTYRWHADAASSFNSFPNSSLPRPARTLRRVNIPLYFIRLFLFVCFSFKVHSAWAISVVPNTHNKHLLLLKSETNKQTNKKATLFMKQACKVEWNEAKKTKSEFRLQEQCSKELIIINVKSYTKILDCESEAFQSIYIFIRVLLPWPRTSGSTLLVGLE